MGKLFDVMSKFENLNENKNMEPKAKSDGEQYKEKISNEVAGSKKSDARVTEDTSSVVVKKDEEYKLESSKVPKVNIPANLEISTSAKSTEPQFIVLNQMMPEEKGKKEKIKQIEDVDKTKIAEELLKYRQEYSKYKYEEIVDKKRMFSKWFNRNKYFVHTKPNSIFSETFKIIRNNVLIKTKDNNIKTIAITSTSASDGKSFIAANLSISIARNFDKHLLLVDTDFRKPTLHNYFNIERKLGLSDYLINSQLKFGEIMRKTNWPKLSVIPVGSFYENSSEILSSKIMDLFIKEIKYRYDDRLVIFDTPPINISDAVAISDMVDGIIIVAKCGKTDKEILEYSIENIEKNKLIGIILNYGKVDMKNYYSYRY